MSDEINKIELNYRFHYENWQTQESQESDIEYYVHYLERHNMTYLPKNSKILEIGCATGNLILALQRLGYTNIQGIDVDRKQQITCKERGLNVTRASALEFLKEDNKDFDVVFMLDVLEHMPKPEQLETLKEIWHAMKDSGILMLSVPNALAPLSHYFENIDWTHYCAFSPTSLGFVLKNAGFSDYTLRPTHQEPCELRARKKLWIDLYAAEFGIKDPIMTPSIVAICFKNKDIYNSYIETAPDLMQNQKQKIALFSYIKKTINKIVRKNG